MARLPPPPVVQPRPIIRHDIAQDYNVEWARPLDPRGQVFRCHSLTDGSTHVVKLLKQSTPTMAQRGERELNMQDYLSRHAPDAVVRIVSVYENVLFYPNNVTEKALLIVMQYCSEGDLFHLLKSRGWCLPEVEAKAMFFAIALCVQKLHLLNVCHRDIKPENILFVPQYSADLSMKTLMPLLADFGHTKFDTASSPLKTAEVGTPRHNAPDVLKGRYTKSVDVFSLGTVLYFMLAGRPPYNADERPPLTFSEPAWMYVSQRAKDLILRMLHADSMQRPTIEAVLEDEWFSLPSLPPMDQHQQQQQPLAMPEVEELFVMQSFDRAQFHERQFDGADPDEDFDLLDLEHPAQRRRVESVESTKGV